MHDSLVVARVRHEGQGAEALVFLAGKEHRALAREEINGVEIVLLHRFAQQFDGHVTSAHEYLAEALRQVVERQGEHAAGADFPVLPELVVAIDEAVGDDAIHFRSFGF